MMEEQNMNKTVCKFQHKFRKYEVDMLIDTKWASSMYYFDVFDVTESSECIGQFEAHDGADYKKLAKEVIKDAEKNK